MWRNLNVFLAWAVLGSLGMTLLLGLHPAISVPLAAAVPAWAWFSGRLVPGAGAGDRTSRQSWGEWLIAAANGVFILGAFSPLLLGLIGAGDRAFAIAFGVCGGFSLVPAVSLWVVGLVCVHGRLPGRQAGNADLVAESGRSDAGVSPRRIVVLLVGAIGLAGAMYFVSNFLAYNRWREEVQLSDGGVIVVSRAVRYRRGSEPGIGTTRWAFEETLTIHDSATGARIVWRGSHRVASLVDQIQGRFWIVGKLTTVCAAGHVGAPRWQAYRYDNGKWHVTDPADAPALSKPNLLLDAFEHAVTVRLRYLGLDEKRTMDRSSLVDDLYRTIDLSFVPRC